MEAREGAGYVAFGADGHPPERRLRILTPGAPETQMSAQTRIARRRYPGADHVAHRSHGDAPYPACPLCIRQTPGRGFEPRWSAPRLG